MKELDERLILGPVRYYIVVLASNMLYRVCKPAMDIETGYFK